MLLPGLAAADSPPPNAIALTFGRCDFETKICRPPSADVAAEGGPGFEAEMLHCFGDVLGRPVYALDAAAPAPRGLWLDIGFSSKQPSNGMQIMTMVLMRDSDSEHASLYFVMPKAKEYEGACHQFAEDIGGWL